MLDRIAAFPAKTACGFITCPRQIALASQQLLEILHTQPTHRAGENAQGSIGVLRAQENGRYSNEVLDLRLPKQSAQTNDFIGHADCIQGLRNERRLFVGAHQNRRAKAARILARIQLRLEVIRYELAFLVFAGEVGQLHLAFWGVIARRQFINWARPAGFRKQVPGDVVSQRQRLLRVTPRNGELILRRRRTVCLRKVLNEGSKVFCRGTAPAINGLHRVAHCGHRNTGADPAEQGAQQHALGMGSVLVLVQHDDVESLALLLAHLRMALRQGRGNSHLLTEGNHAASGLLFLEGLHQWQILHAQLLLIEEILDFFGKLRTIPPSLF